MGTVAVAVDRLEHQRAGFVAQSPLRSVARRQKVKLQKFFGKCEMADGSVTILVAKALTAVEASKKLHKGYRIVVVIDIMTEADMPREWAKFKPSLIQRSQLM